MDRMSPTFDFQNSVGLQQDCTLVYSKNMFLYWCMNFNEQSSVLSLPRLQCEWGQNGFMNVEGEICTTYCKMKGSHLPF